MVSLRDTHMPCFGNWNPPPLLLPSPYSFLLTALVAFSFGTHPTVAASGLVPQLVALCRPSCKLKTMVSEGVLPSKGGPAPSQCAVNMILPAGGRHDRDVCTSRGARCRRAPKPGPQPCTACTADAVGGGGDPSGHHAPEQGKGTDGALSVRRPLLIMS